MIKSEEVYTKVTKNKERDAEICNLFLNENLSMEEIGEKFDLTSQGVGYILRNNKSLLVIDREFHKAKRINVLERMLSKASETLSRNRDKTDIVEQLRKEYEGDSKTVINNSVSNSSVKLSKIDSDGLRAIIALGRERIISERTA
jgi:predicted DNA-binding protein YlxM (UPF0122 family)